MAVLKILVVGPSQAGKTLMTRVLAQHLQPCKWDPEAYVPTVAVRVEEVERQVSREKCEIQFWDMSGDEHYSEYWSTVAKDLDGLIMVYNPAEVGSHEQRLEKLYKACAQPNNLSMKNCAIMGLNISGAPAGGSGLQGKLQKLPHFFLELDTTSQQGLASTHKDLYSNLDPLFEACLSRKTEIMERAVMGAD